MKWPWQKWKPEISGVISGAALRQNLRKICPEAQVITLDREYQIPADPGDVTWHYSPFNLKYLKSRRDCEDFNRIVQCDVAADLLSRLLVDIVRGELSRDAFGDLLVMDCVVNPPGPGPQHALLAFLDGDKIVFGEPQTGKMRTFDEVEIIRLIA